MRLKILLLGAGFILAASSLHAIQVKTLSYGPDKAQVLDIYTPEISAGKKLPMVVLAHGGLWQTGGRQALATLCKNIISQSGNNIACASIDYRLSQDLGGICDDTGSDTYKEQVGDMLMAYTLLQDEAELYGIDPGRMFIGGHSAGAHLAHILNLRWSEFTQVCEHSNGCPAAIGAIGLEGIYDIPAWNDYDAKFWQGQFKCATRKAFGSPGPTPPARMDTDMQQRSWDAGSPTYLAKNPDLLKEKPVGDALLIHSTGDDWVDSAESSSFGAALGNSFPDIKVVVKTGGSCAVGQHNDMLDEPALAECISQFVLARPLK